MKYWQIYSGFFNIMVWSLCAAVTEGVVQAISTAILVVSATLLGSFLTIWAAIEWGPPPDDFFG